MREWEKEKKAELRRKPLKRPLSQPVLLFEDIASRAKSRRRGYYGEKCSQPNDYRRGYIAKALWKGRCGKEVIERRLLKKRYRTLLNDSAAFDSDEIIFYEVRNSKQSALQQLFYTVNVREIDFFPPHLNLSTSLNLANSSIYLKSPKRNKQ